MEIKLNYDKKGFEGFVTVKVASNIERLKILDDLGIGLNDFINQKDEDSKIEEKFNNISTMIKLLEASKDFYKEVKLKKDGKKYNSFDDLNNDFACQEIQMDVAMKGLLNLGDARKKS